MEKNLSHNKYSCHKNISWIIEQDRIVLYKSNSKRKYILHYPEIALWDFLSRDIPVERIISMLSVLMNKDLQSTENWVIGTVDNWQQKGILIKGD